MSEQTIQNELFSNNVTILDKYECLSFGERVGIIREVLKPAK